MGDNGVSARTARLPEFDGTHASFQIWWVRFAAFAMVHHFVQALAIGGEPLMPAKDTDAVDETTADGKLIMKAKERNARAMANLTLALNEVTMGIVYEAMTDAYIGGLAHLVIKGLFKKYQPQDIMSKVELRTMLNNIKMKPHEDPAKLFNQISSLKQKYNTSTKKIDDEDLIAVVLSQAPPSYQALLTSEQRVKGNNLTVADLEETMYQYWRQVKSTDAGKAEKEDTEMTLAAFGGVCFTCNKRGHRASDCPEKGNGKSTNKKFEGTKKNGDKKAFNGNCFNCGKSGHRSSDCWKKEENKSKRPSNYNTGAAGEHGAAAVDKGKGSRVEFMLCAIAGNEDESNEWIGDAGASMHRL
jgi:hypothetical protein